MSSFQEKCLIFNKHSISNLLPLKECVSLMHKTLSTLSTSTNVANPLRQAFKLPLQYTGILGSMPAFIGKWDGEDYMGTKIISVFPENTDRESHQGVVLLFSAKDGRLLSISDAGEITARRTACVSACAAKALVRTDKKSYALGILGTGLQARMHIKSITISIPSISKIQIWGRNIQKAKNLAKEFPNFNCEAKESAREVVESSDIICTVTSSRTPILMGEWLQPGSLVIAVGASQKDAREVDSEAIAKSRFFVDRIESAKNESAAYLIALKQGKITENHIVAELGDVLSGKNQGRRTNDEIIIFKSLGLAVEDITSAIHIYQKGLISKNVQSVNISNHVNSFETHSDISLADIFCSQERLRNVAMRTPIPQLNIQLSQSDVKIFLKLENLQPVQSYKLRGAYNALSVLMQRHKEKMLQHGVFTASAGNFGMGITYCARNLSISLTVVVPDHAPQTKIDSMKQLYPKVKIIKVPFDEWWKVITTGQLKDHQGIFISPVTEKLVMAGNGTIGLEILEDLDKIDCILIPYGGGGLSIGIASAVRALKPDVKIFACEVETAAPLSASLQAKTPVKVEYKPSFIDGIGSTSVFPEMFKRAQKLLDGSLVVSVQETAAAVKLLAERNRVIAEGAGAVSVAAALKYYSKYNWKRIVCIISGGNIDMDKFASILQNKI